MNYSRFHATSGLALCLLWLAAAPARAQLDPTISTATDEHFAYGANIGWINFRWDTGSPGKGAAVTDFFLAGMVYSANCGWIDLGDGSPVDGIHYQNTIVSSENDFGVNHDGLGNLGGYAYGANVGWINFGNPAAWNDPPEIDLSTGIMSGYAYSANCGWIDLGSNGSVVVKTTVLTFIDSDGDMISDAWELQKVADAGMTTGSIAGDLAIIGKTTDNDGDEDKGLDEYLADTNPFDDTSHLRITLLTVDPAGPPNIDLTWTSVNTRVYDVKASTTGLEPGDFSVVTPNVPGIGPTNNQTYNEAVTGRKFWVIEPKLPLAP